MNQLNQFTTPTPRVPLATQVEAVEQSPPNTLLSNKNDSPNIMIRDKNKTITFKLSRDIENKPRRQWKRKMIRRDQTQLNEKAQQLLRDHRRREKMQRKQANRKMARRGEVPTAVMDSGATSTCIKQEDVEHVHVLRENSKKKFYNANGTISNAGKKAQLKYDIRHPASDADIVPELALNSLLSTSKLADANYITIFTKDEVQVFDAETTKFNIEGNAIMQGWRCPETRLWRVPLCSDWSNINTDTTLLSTKATDIILNKRQLNDTMEFANSSYELPNLEQVVAWHHAAAGYPTKAT